MDQVLGTLDLSIDPKSKYAKKEFDVIYNNEDQFIGI